MKKQKKEPYESRLTSHMDFGTRGFDEFQAILLKTSKELSDNQKRKIELLTHKYQINQLCAS